jgi:hypothetical protein
MSRHQNQATRPSRRLAVAQQQPTIPGVRVVDLANYLSLRQLSLPRTLE